MSDWEICITLGHDLTVPIFSIGKLRLMNFDRNAKSPAPGSPGASPSTASVPISVYRELAAELQATQAMLDSLHGQNQHLRKQNRHLQQEVDSIFQAAQKRQYLVDGHPASRPSPPAPRPESAARPAPPPRGMRPPRQPQAKLPQERSPQPPSPIPPRTAAAGPMAGVNSHPGAVETLNKIFTGREQPLPRQPLSRDRGEDISTWWLVALVLLIVVTAFGTGFMLVRPLLAPAR
jgi:hypothetical protein